MYFTKFKERLLKMVSIGKCEHCGKETEYKYKSFVRRYCSHSCSNKASAQKRRSKDFSVIRCEECGLNFSILSSVKRAREAKGKMIKYCSQKCSGKSKTKQKEVNCKNCENKFLTTRNQFCSEKCFYQYRKNSGLYKKKGYWYENGYKILYLDGNKYIKEHISIMENNLGRKLEKNEVVHHINEIRDDNRIENLQVMTRSEHSSLHRRKEISEGKTLFKNK